ncbi:MAG: ribosome biogenesis GTPase Der [Gammaproteobacteria bacterium]|nr:ribosome biogenesis GTPase Der [Gammaproteobacteria bacterium]MCW8987060.1 ribosome biogenesis GTPase Der [Gammaproteobacteria bacterium]MCW9030705.1 ribosome biogenesis GTPase Der [Gammaproteobacteria bacterium]
MKPVIALVGRPNVGKSTLFNRLTRSRDALVVDQPGMTRDRKYGDGKLGDIPYIVIDTGGLSGEVEGLDALMAEQSWLAVEEANIILFMTDAHDGLTAMDEDIAKRLRNTGKDVILVVNKIDGHHEEVVTAEFFALGLGEPKPIAASQGRGVTALMESILADLPEPEIVPGVVAGIKIAIVGRPNVGKSTLVNRILGEERVVAFDMPGTTRDSIYLPFERDGQQYTIIDTAGVRRRGKVHEVAEKYSVIKALQAIQDANVVIMVLDAQDTISEQDVTLLGYIMDAGRALVISINKWDGLDEDQKEKIKTELDYKLPFLTFAKKKYISAKHGTGVGDLFGYVNTAYKSAMAEFSTPKLTKLLEFLVQQHQPPIVKGHRIKLRYAHQGGKNPPIIVIHGNQTESVPDSYRRYLYNAFLKRLDLHGTPIRIEFKTGDNPFKDKKNKLTARQQSKRRRMMRHVK